MTRVGTDDHHDAAATDNLALITHTADAGANLHRKARGNDRPRLRQKWDGERVSEYMAQPRRFTRGALSTAKKTHASHLLAGHCRKVRGQENESVS